MSRTIGPLVALVLGVGLGWVWGKSAAPQPPPPPPVCDPASAIEQVAPAMLEHALLQAELDGGW